MYAFCKKLFFLFYYQRAVNLASQEKYLDAIDILIKAPFKEEFFVYSLLAAFLYERLRIFDESLIFYDKAKYLINDNMKLNKDDKNYLYKYINNSYSYIYRQQNKLTQADNIKKENLKIIFNLNNVKKSIRNDFVIS